MVRFSHLTHSFLPLNILLELLYFSLRVYADYIFVGLVSYTPSLEGGDGPLLHYPLSGVFSLQDLVPGGGVVNACLPAAQFPPPPPRALAPALGAGLPKPSMESRQGSPGQCHSQVIRFSYG